MPCVCLTNTFAYWKSLKAQKQLERKPVAAPVVFPPKYERAAAGSSDFKVGEVVRVPHQRKVYIAKVSEQTPENAKSVLMWPNQTTFDSVATPGSTVNAALGAMAKLSNDSTVNATFAANEKATKAAITLSPKSAPSLYTPKKARKTWLGSLKAHKTARMFTKSLRRQRIPQNDTPNVNFNRPSVRMTRADLINAESKLGSTIFGPIPAGHRREFFHDHGNIWIWHEDWLDGQNNSHQMTVRYEVRTSGIYKKVSAGKYLKLEGDELENFRKATHVYLDVIKKYLYNSQKMSRLS